MQTIRVCYPSGRQMLVVMTKWLGFVRIGRAEPTVVVETLEGATAVLDPRAVIIDEETGEWLYGPRDEGVRLRGEMRQWMWDNPNWGKEVPPKHPTPLRWEEVIKNAKPVDQGE